MTALDRFTSFLLAHWDKLAHAFFSGFFALLGFLIGSHWGFPTGMILSLLLPGFLGAGKEVWDKYHPPHEASWADFIADIAGAAVVWAAILLARHS